MAMTAETLRRLPARVVSEATGANQRTVERWRAGMGPRRAEYRVKLDDLAAILAILGEQMGPKATQAWLTGRSAHLGWRRPIELLARGEFDRVRGAAMAYAAGDPT
ncbi:MAG TPA: hypothetical protein VH987_11005 [Candidatus Limnocylindria bacterium]|jgi:hypothetical protein